MANGLESALALIETRGILRPQDLVATGIPREYLHRLHRRGEVIRIGRGLYSAPGTSDPHLPLALACARVPHGIICLRSADAFHRLISGEVAVWLAIDRKARRPKVDGVKLEVVRFSGAALTDGVEEHLICGVKVRVTSPARTVVDLFRYRLNRNPSLGTHVAAEALRAYRKSKAFSMADLELHMVNYRMARVMEPYLLMLD